MYLTKIDHRTCRVCRIIFGDLIAHGDYMSIASHMGLFSDGTAEGSQFAKAVAAFRQKAREIVHHNNRDIPDASIHRALSQADLDFMHPADSVHCKRCNLLLRSLSRKAMHIAEYIQNGTKPAAVSYAGYTGLIEDIIKHCRQIIFWADYAAAQSERE